MTARVTAGRDGVPDGWAQVGRRLGANSTAAGCREAGRRRLGVTAGQSRPRRLGASSTAAERKQHGGWMQGGRATTTSRRRGGRATPRRHGDE